MFTTNSSTFYPRVDHIPNIIPNTAFAEPLLANQIVNPRAFIQPRVDHIPDVIMPNAAFVEELLVNQIVHQAMPGAFIRPSLVQLAFQGTSSFKSFGSLHQIQLSSVHHKIPESLALDLMPSANISLGVLLCLIKVALPAISRYIDGLVFVVPGVKAFIKNFIINQKCGKKTEPKSWLNWCATKLIYAALFVPLTSSSFPLVRFVETNHMVLLGTAFFVATTGLAVCSEARRRTIWNSVERRDLVFFTLSTFTYLYFFTDINSSKPVVSFIYFITTNRDKVVKYVVDNKYFNYFKEFCFRVFEEVLEKVKTWFITKYGDGINKGIKNGVKDANKINNKIAKDFLAEKSRHLWNKSGYEKYRLQFIKALLHALKHI